MQQPERASRQENGRVGHPGSQQSASNSDGSTGTVVQQRIGAGGGQKSVHPQGAWEHESGAAAPAARQLPPSAAAGGDIDAAANAAAAASAAASGPAASAAAAAAAAGRCSCCACCSCQYCSAAWMCGCVWATKLGANPASRLQGGGRCEGWCRVGLGLRGGQYQRRDALGKPSTEVRHLKQGWATHSTPMLCSEPPQNGSAPSGAPGPRT